MSAVLLVLGACSEGPDAAAVLERVQSLRGPGRPVVDWTFAFTPKGKDLALIATAEGERFERVLPSDADCTALTEATAVVLLMLEVDLEEAIRARRVVRSPAAPAPGVPVERAPSTFEGGLGQGVTLTWPSLPWKLVALGVWRPAASMLGLGAHLRFHAPRRAASDLLEVQWTRLEARVGPDFLVPLGPIDLAFAAEGLAGVIWLEGRSPLGHAAFTSWDLGGSGSVRASLGRAEGPRPWVELSVFGWARAHRVSLSGTDVVNVLPVVEADVSVGISWGR